MWFRKRQPVDDTLKYAHKLGHATMIDPSRVYFWALRHDVDLKMNKKRLLRNGLLEWCVFNDLDLEDGEALDRKV